MAFPAMRASRYFVVLQIGQFAQGRDVLAVGDGMPLDRGRSVVQGFRDDRYRGKFGQFAQGPSRAARVANIRVSRCRRGRR
jgi:hypothetical protein